MLIAIHGKIFQKEIRKNIQDLFICLKKHNIEACISASFHKILKKSLIKHLPENVYEKPQELKDCQFFLSLGGDGTLLESVTHVGALEIPIVGINTGRLGFLATHAPAQIKMVLERLLEGFYQIDERTLLHLESNKDIFDGYPFALNDFTITKRDSASMITVHTFINGEYLNSYWADGLIVATPTGSTGYSLSCGGPLILPRSHNFVITPVSPHNLTVRPMVISDESVISFEIEGRSKNFLVSLDSRSRVIDASVQLAVSKEKFKAKLVKANDTNFLDTLRSKLNWGWDARN
ncbi:MAG: NAD kinase [Raineya sp.]|nr:NAD kinase [Raineya sp.]MDW8296178.1 NAD kinase [Raineya sp.]